MENLLENLTIINQADTRQQGKNKYQLNEIIGITFSAMTANTNDFQEIAAFTQIYHTQRQQYFPNMKKPQPRHHPTRLRHARPSLPPNLPNPIQPTTKPKRKPKNQKTPPLDGKTQKGNKTKTQKPNHTISAVNENGFCIGQKLVDEKSNEITATPKLLDHLDSR